MQKQGQLPITTTRTPDIELRKKILATPRTWSLVALLNEDTTFPKESPKPARATERTASTIVNRKSFIGHNLIYFNRLVYVYVFYI